MSLHWSDDQQRWLAAMGYTIFRPVVPGSSMESRTASQPLPGSSVRAATAIAAQPAHAPADHENVSTPLLRALLRAADLDPSGIADVTGWLRSQQISLAQLRNDPGSKRLLWPRLRALRRQSASR